MCENIPLLFNADAGALSTLGCCFKCTVDSVVDKYKMLHDIANIDTKLINLNI
jgi:hypothetical protein